MANSLASEYKGVKVSMFSCQLISFQQCVLCQPKTLASKRNYEEPMRVVHESIEVESSLPLLMTERYHFAQKEEAPILLESKQRMEETLEKGATACNVENVDGNISIHQQNNSNYEEHDDVDDLSAKDLLCLAWQIAQGMVSGILSRESRTKIIHSDHTLRLWEVSLSFAPLAFLPLFYYIAGRYF